jgi:N-acetylglucosaminyl-diphospho-decaprenol L-rhamnosyltransferase
MYCVSYHRQAYELGWKEVTFLHAAYSCDKAMDSPGSAPLMPTAVLGTVVVVSHNSGGCIRQCLQALVPFTQWKIVLVDNHSTDDTVRIVSTLPLEMCTVINAQNAGFASAVNQAAKLAEGDLLVLLNPDTVATMGSIDKLVEALRMDSMGAAGGLLQSEDGLPQKGFTVRRFPTIGSMLAEILLLNRAWPSNPWNVHYRCLDLDYQKAQEIEQPAGACLAVKRRAWDEINGFDEGFFPVWFEDVDFCRRLRDAGWRIVYCPDAIFAHAGGHSVSKLSFRDRQSYWYKNLVRYFAKHHSRAQTIILRVGITVGLLFRALLSLMGFHPSGTSISEAVAAYWHAAWHYGVRGGDL